MVKHPFAFSLGTRQGAVIYNFHLTPHQYLAPDFCCHLLGQIFIVRFVGIRSTFDLNQHHVTAAFTLLEMDLKFTADAFHMA